MNIPTIEQGEELLKKVSDAEWNWDANNPQHQLLAFFVSHASELLQCAREVEGLKARIEVLENPLPTQEEEREFYHRAYHVCHTGCPMPCPNRT